MTMARSSGWMRIEYFFRRALDAAEKCVEDSGGVQPRQENSAECEVKSQHRPNFSDLALALHSALRLLSVLAYAFPMRYVLGFDGGGTKTDFGFMNAASARVSLSRTAAATRSPVTLD